MSSGYDPWMQNRDDAIRWLTEKGYLAFARDWAAGESIGIAKSVVEGPYGLQQYAPTLVWVFPDRSEDWLLLSPGTVGPTLSFASLAEAVTRAVEIIDGWGSE
jgi:hypothetical protein